MGVQVGTILKWFNPDDKPESAEWDDSCQEGQCVGIVTKLVDSDKEDNVAVWVKWWETCTKHTKVDPNGTGPYVLRYIWQIGQLY